MNSENSKPMFLYSYDPPSPDVLSEYDPPYPLEIGTPRSTTGNFEYPSLVLGDNSFSEPYPFLAEENSILCSELSFNNEEIFDHPALINPSTGLTQEMSSIRKELDVEPQLSTSDIWGHAEDCSINNNDSLTTGAKENDVKLKTKENMKVSNYEMDGKAEIYSAGDIKVKSTDFLYITSVDSSENQKHPRKTSPPDSQRDTLSDESYKPFSNESLNGSTVTMLSENSLSTMGRENNCSASTSHEPSEPLISTDATSEEAICSSPQSTIQSVSSLLSDTITINVPFDSSFSGNDIPMTDCDDDTRNTSFDMAETFSERQSATFNDVTDQDSAFPSPSPTFSPFLTESCPLTPFPTDFPTPYSTNPTSSPLPSPIPSEVLSNPTSESTPSTPSTVTSSTMFCVSRKLESLTNNANVSDFASNKDNCSENVQSSKSENAVSNNPCDEGGSHHMKTSLVSDASMGRSINNERQLYSGSNNANEMSLVTFERNNFEAESTNNTINESDYLEQAKDTDTKMGSKKDNRIANTLNEDVKSGKRKHISNVIYRYTPNMKNSNVNELKQIFMNQKLKSTHDHQKPPMWRARSEPKVSPKLAVDDRRVKEKSLEPFVPNAIEAPPPNDIPETNIPTISNEPQPHLSPPPPPPPRLDSSLKSLPPPLPPPPKEEDDNDEEVPPPVPSLPLNFSERIEKVTSPVPPSPPVRQYLLIPITPGKGTPLLLTPPSTPQRSSSYCKSPPPPPPPPARQSTPSRELDRPSNGYPEYLNTSGGVTSPLKNNIFLTLNRELTPVPEERPSPISQTPSPNTQGPVPSPNIINEEVDQRCIGGIEVKRRLSENEGLILHEPDESNCKLPPIPPLPRNSVLYPSPSPSPSPPPLPPKINELKISPSLKLPPPPPPPPPKRSRSLIGTPNTTASELSPCRVLDRSPPNDRDFTISPADTDSALSTSHEPASPSSLANPPLTPAPAPMRSTVPSPSCLSVSPYGKMVINRSDLPLPSPDEEMRKVFANVKRWGWIDSNRDTLALYTQFRPIIQNGPQCGLVALSMASQACPFSVSTEDLLQESQKKGISKHGEMFSARAMSELANQMLEGVTASVSRNVLTSPSEVIKILVEGNFILFPYDAEPNHFPGLRRGRKAHWGLLCGCLIQKEGLIFRTDSSFAKADSQVDFLWHARPVNRSTNRERPPEGFNDVDLGDPSSEGDTLGVVSPTGGRLLSDDFGSKDWYKDVSNLIVLYRQGKSRNLVYASLRDVCASNEQLLEYPSEEDYVIGSVEDGLAGQVVVLRKERQGLSDLLGVLREKEDE